MLATTLAALALAVGTTGCSTLLAVRGQQAAADANAVVSGHVRLEDSAVRGPLVVGLVARSGHGHRLVDHFVAERPGPFLFVVEPGTYWLAAFEDRDGDGRYLDEPAWKPSASDAITLRAGEHRDGIDLRIPNAGRFAATEFALDELEARSHAEQATRSLYDLSSTGRVTNLDDPRFAQEAAESGMWRPWDFLLRAGPGIWFLEPWDPSRVPVLFVHGIGGTPAQFRELVDSLDRRRYQAWVAWYPTGFDLGMTGDWLAQLFARLRSGLRFPRAVVVAHSMGGLVARRFLLTDVERSGDTAVDTFVTISSPLGGMESAARGVEESPVVVRSWRGLAPGSDFLDGLFWSDLPARTVRRRLPASMRYHMMFGYHGSSDDGVVPLSSQLRKEAQDEAASMRGFDATHVGILSSPGATARLGAILAGER